MENWNHNAAYYGWIREKVKGCRSVLDVGCGNGDLLFRLAEKGRKCVGIDVEGSCIERCVRNNRDADTSFVCTSFWDYEATEGSFDAVIFVASLHHMDMYKAIEKAKRLLRKDGKLIIVGLSKPSSLSDHVRDILRVLPSFVMTKLHKMQQADVPVSYEMPEMKDVREFIRKELPGAELRYGLYWRYLVCWRK